MTFYVVHKPCKFSNCTVVVVKFNQRYPYRWLNVNKFRYFFQKIKIILR